MPFDAANAMASAAQATGYATTPKLVRTVLFDTYIDGERSDSGQEACLFGEDMMAVAVKYASGRNIELSGPQGSVDLDESHWLEFVVSAFKDSHLKGELIRRLGGE